MEKEGGGPVKRLLLDWDGVVRADYYSLRTDTPEEKEAERARFVSHRPHGVSHELLVDPAVVARLNAVADRADVTVTWLTAVGRFAPDVFAPAVGLSSFGNTPGASGEPGQSGAPMSGFPSNFWWKAVVARDLLESSHDDILWIDDNLDGDLQHYAGWWEGVGELSWIQPNGRLGLSVGELELIDAWADGETVRHSRW